MAFHAGAPGVLHVGVQGLGGSGRARHDAVFAALPVPDEELPPQEVEVRDVEADALPEADPGTVEDLEMAWSRFSTWGRPLRQVVEPGGAGAFVL